MKITAMKKLYPVFFITLFDQISITVGFPVLTFLCFDRHSTLFAASASHATRSIWYGILSSSPYIVAIAAAPLLSFFSDHFGRKRLLMVGALGALFYSVITAVSILYGMLMLLFVGSLVCGFCARTEPVALAVVSDLSEAAEKKVNMGYLQVSISIGAFLGPIIGGYFAKRFLFSTLNFSFPYMIGAAVGLLTVMLTAFYFKETFKPSVLKKPRFFQSLNSLLKPGVLKISVILAITQMSWRLYYQFVPPILKITQHYSPTMIGLFIALIAFWLIVASAFGIKLLDRFLAAKKILSCACYAMFLGLLILILGTHLVGIKRDFLIWLSAIPMAMGDVVAYCMIVTFYSEMVSADNQGKIMGLNFIVVSVIWSIAGLLGGGLAAININFPIYFALFVMLPLLMFFCRDSSRAVRC